MKTLIITAYILLSSLSNYAQEKKDTVPVLMLVTDTLWNGAAYHLRGYSVRGWDNTVLEIPTNCNNPGCLVVHKPQYEQRGWVHVHYIDYNKKPLPKNIVVWSVKENL